MNAEEARAVIRGDPDGDIMKRLEAIDVALGVLGRDAGMREIYGWAEGRTELEEVDTGAVH